MGRQPRLAASRNRSRPRRGSALDHRPTSRGSPQRRKAMKLLSRLHLTAIAAVVIMAVGVGVAVAGTQHHNPGARGQKGKCAHGRQLERNKATVVAYYTTAFNDKKPEEAVAKYGGPVYIQHNPPAAGGFAAFIAFVKQFTTANPPLHAH